jgi:hypothetical protein
VYNTSGRRAELAKAYATLMAEGFQGLTYVKGDTLFAPDPVRTSHWRYVTRI